MNIPASLPLIVAPSVLGLTVVREGGNEGLLAPAAPEALAMTGVAVGLYVLLGVLCLAAGLAARFAARFAARRVA